jgi:hypothetical protein
MCRFMLLQIMFVLSFNPLVTTLAGRFFFVNRTPPTYVRISCTYIGNREEQLLFFIFSFLLPEENKVD